VRPPTCLAACLPCCSYLIFGEEKTALVDASHEKFRGLYMRTLNAELAARGRKIDYVLVSHTEPDHSGERAWSTVRVLRACDGCWVAACLRVACTGLGQSSWKPVCQANPGQQQGGCTHAAAKQPQHDAG